MAARFAHNYENVPVRKALEALAAAPSMELLDALLDACKHGGLAIDVTGSDPKGEPVARTITSTDGQPVLPLFTSIREVSSAIAKGGGKGTRIQAAVLPARDALTILRDERIVAVQFNPGKHGLVVSRDHILRALESFDNPHSRTAVKERKVREND